MIARHIHHALAQVQELQQRVVEAQRFRGYSGRARAYAGTWVLFTALALASGHIPKTAPAHLAGWGLALALGVIVNYGALAYWFFFDPTVKRDWRRLRPAFEVVPPLLVGFVLTLAMIAHGQFQYLFGTWMCLFGLANLASRQVLPKAIWLLGCYYLACGTICLLADFSFLNPWPMGGVFFVGEWAAGLILHYDVVPHAPLGMLLNSGETDDDQG